MAETQRSLSESAGWASRYRNEFGLVLAIVAVIGATLAFNTDYLAQPKRNFQDITQQAGLLGIFALGAAVVIIAGGIDLSSGSVIVFSGSTCAMVMMLLAPLDDNQRRDLSHVGLTGVMLAIAAALVVGLVVGTVHTWLITVVKLPPFVATLASLVGLRSLSKILNQAVTAELGNQVTKISAQDETFLKLREWWVAPVVFLVLGLACWFLLNRTVVGRHLYALGGNEDAARLSGIRTDLLKWLAYTIGSVTASIAGVLYTAKVTAADPSTMAVGYELNAIASAVVGGCSLAGGVGSIPGVMLGVLFLRMVMDSVAKVVRAGSDDFQGSIVGLLVVLAVAFNELRRQTRGTQKEFFPGMLGIATIPILAGLVGTFAFVFTRKNTSWKGGVATAVIVFAALIVVKVVEVKRARRVA